MDALLQALVNGLLSGSLIAVPAVGFTALFAILRYPSFAVAGYVSVGAFAGWWVNTRFGLGAAPALVMAFIAGGLSGLACEMGALRRLMPSGALTVSIASIAVNLVLENILRFVFGNDLRGFDLPILPDLQWGGVFIGVQQLWNLALAVAVVAAVFGFLMFTRFGRAMRAVADNPDLARLKGIDPRRIAAIAVVLGAGLAGAGGVLLGLDTSIDPMTGYRVLLSVFAAAVLGGLGSVPGAVVGALVLGLAEELALLAVPATYRTAVGFAAILLILTFRPRGLLGEKAV
ncbi:branched-chain amino acid ABC transporter permease [Roseomonas sp. GC11]|uniref:branched-chain amino acid ABC transporter permease n=1 Tax=Roseomonas sp. GC11 TaxID=2950546 RepID=UPI0021093AED|nr:branched-chain amino acid ABC transporter permease [Roseomonas sp. GC11]MCQ4160085.1 branched-chain amino acid ABC transporter permease [Roseomonas sp. GC11]